MLQFEELQLSLWSIRKKIKWKLSIELIAIL